MTGAERERVRPGLVRRMYLRATHRPGWRPGRRSWRLIVRIEARMTNPPAWAAWTRAVADCMATTPSVLPRRVRVRIARSRARLGCPQAYQVWQDELTAADKVAEARWADADDRARAGSPLPEARRWWS